MTIVNLMFTKPTETFHFNPPLPPAKGMKVVCYHGRFKPWWWEALNLFCDIVDPLSSYYNPKNDVVRPSQLLAVLSNITKFTTVGVRKSINPINSMKFTILKQEDGELLDFDREEGIREPIGAQLIPFLACLKIYH